MSTRTASLGKHAGLIGGTAALALVFSSVDVQGSLIHHYEFSDPAGNAGSTVFDVAPAPAPVVDGETFTGTPIANDPEDLRADATPSPAGGYYGDFIAGGVRSRLMFANSGFNSEIAGAEGSGAFTVTMMLRDLTIAGTGRNSYDRAFFGETFSGGGGGQTSLFHDATETGTGQVGALPVGVRINGTDYAFGTVDLTNATTGDSDGWILMAMTYSTDEDEARLYVGKDWDGGTWTDLSEVASAQIDPETQINSAVRAMVFGGAFHTENPNALYDDFRLYSSVLSEAEIAAIPEPASLALMGLGSLLLIRRRREGQAT